MEICLVSQRSGDLQQTERTTKMGQTDKLAASLEHLFSEQGKQLFVYALSLTGSAEQAEDAVQEAFYHLFRLRRRPGHLKAYVYRSVRNAAIDQLRRDRPTSAQVSESLYDPDHEPGEKVAVEELKQKVVEAMKILSDDERRNKPRTCRHNKTLN